MTENRKRSLIFGKYMLIQSRCYNPMAKSYKDYGAKGVTMCEEWRLNFESFYTWCTSNGWEEGITIDKDVLCDKLSISPKIYSPSTCILMSRSANSIYANSQRVYPHVLQYDMNGLFIREYSSAAIAGRVTGAVASNILKVCHKERTVANGFQWKFKDDSTTINKYTETYRYSRMVAQISLDTDEIIAVYKSIKEAALTLDVSSSSIGNVCKKLKLPSGNSRLTAHGFKWEYVLD